MSRRGQNVGGTLIARWGPEHGSAPGEPEVRLRAARGCRLPQDPPIRGTVIDDALPTAFRRGRSVPRGGPRNILRNLGPWVRAYYSRADS